MRCLPPVVVNPRDALLEALVERRHLLREVASRASLAKFRATASELLPLRVDDSLLISAFGSREACNGFFFVDCLVPAVVQKRVSPSVRLPEWVLWLGLLDNCWTNVVKILLPIHRDLVSVDDRFCLCKGDVVLELGCEAFGGDIEVFRYIS